MTLARTLSMAMLAAVMFGATPTHAETSPPRARIVAESDTGVVFGDLNCRLTKIDSVDSVKFSADPFDYLAARVTVKYTCVMRDGRKWSRIGSDSMIFPTLEFNWETQRWETGGTWIAERSAAWFVALNERLEHNVWLAADPDGSIAIKVQFKPKPADLQRR